MKRKSANLLSIFVILLIPICGCNELDTNHNTGYNNDILVLKSKVGIADMMNVIFVLSDQLKEYQ